MKTGVDQLPGALARGISSFYLVSGDETLLTDEAADAIRAAARAAQYADREIFFADRGFDWDTLRSAAQSLSLFAQRRIIEIRMPSGKPEKGAELLRSLIEHPVPETIILVICEKLDRKASDTPWVKAVQERGVWVAVGCVAAAALPAWLQGRAQQSNLQLDSRAAEMIAARVEGNLLAAAQEIVKLGLLATDRHITTDLVVGSVADSARFDVFSLTSAAASGKTLRALHILDALRSEGIEPTLIMWALGRELRGLWQARERERLRSTEPGSTWNLASPPSAQSIAHARNLPLAALLQEAAHVDQVIKGVTRGDSWAALRALTAGLSGALQRTMLSGRVVP